MGAPTVASVTTYAVKWREPDGQTFLGRLVLGPTKLRLVGRRRGADGPTVDRQIGYAELQDFRIGSGGAERLDERPSLVLEGTDGRYLVTSAGMGAPIVQELLGRLTDLRSSSSRTLAL